MNFWENINKLLGSESRAHINGCASGERCCENTHWRGMKLICNGCGIECKKKV